MFLHDINAPNVENKEALAGARESVALFRYMPPVVSWVAWREAPLTTALQRRRYLLHHRMERDCQSAVQGAAASGDLEGYGR